MRLLTFIKGFLLGLLLLGVGAGALWLLQRVDPGAIAGWKREVGPVPFFIALAILPAVGFPTGPFYILAGASYPLWVNIIGISASLAFHVAMTYWLARTWLRSFFEWLLLKTGYTLPMLDEKRALRFALLVKMAPGLPTFLKNYAIGMSGISFKLHFIVCFSVTACYAAIFATMGDSIVERDLGTGVISVALFLVLAFGLYLLRRRMQLGENNPESPEPALAESQKES